MEIHTKIKQIGLIMYANISNIEYFAHHC